MITFSESDYTFSGCDAQERPPFNVFWHSIAFNPVRAPEGAHFFGGSDIHVRSSFLLNFQRFSNLRLLFTTAKNFLYPD